MSSIAAEAVVNINLDLGTTTPSTGSTTAPHSGPDPISSGGRPISYTSVDLYTPDSDLKKDLGDYFSGDTGYQKSSNNAEAGPGPSSAGLIDDGYDYFSTVPVLEKGTNNGHEQSSGVGVASAPGQVPAPTFAILPFVLDESTVRSEGGWAGWTCVAGSWLILFATSGYANAFGVFQAHYQFFGYPTESPSSISWIGSIQWFLQFSAGIVAGPLYDRGYFHHLVTGGGIIYIISLFMTSLCQELWQTILAQAVGTGLGLGLVFLPSLSVLGEHFYRKRALAMGIATTGACVGGVVIPIMLNNLMSTHPFKNSVQYTAYLLLGCLLVGRILMRPVPRTKIQIQKNQMMVETPPAKVDMKSLFKSRGYCYLTAGLCFACLGVFFPSFYLQIFASEKGVEENLASYTVAIINAASTIGRLASALGDIYGPLNILFITCLINSILCFCIFAASTPPGLIMISILYGISSGVFNSIMAPSLMSLARTQGEVGSRLGVGFLICGFGALAGTPLTGMLLDKVGWGGGAVFSGGMVVLSSGMVGVAIIYQRREKGSWKV